MSHAPIEHLQVEGEAPRTCITSLDTYRRLRHLPPEPFALRIRLMARSAGCNVAQSQHVGEQARIAAIAGSNTRWHIIQTSRALATALAEGRACMPAEAATAGAPA